MKISRETTLANIQREFNTQFPNLKIEFYKAAHQFGEGSSEREHLDNNLSMETIGITTEFPSFNIDQDLSVGDFEKEFSEKFKLFVQVFRKSGNLWMQTTSTDHWSLKEQNRKGGASEMHFNEKEN